MRAPANSNIGPQPTRDDFIACFAPTPEDFGVAMARRAAEARREYQEHGAAADALAALRASPDFAPVYAEPGEMERRQGDEAAAHRPAPIRAWVIIGLAVSAPVVAVLFAAWMRGGL